MRVASARVEVEGEEISHIKRGLLIFIGIKKDDSERDVDLMARKIASLRIFDSEKGNFDLSVKDVDGEVMVISEFTLYGDIRKGRRPSFDDAASKEKGKVMFRSLINRLKDMGLDVKEGVFGAHMCITIHNDGPVTFVFETQPL